MYELELPALLSNSPLGFLAALGVLELATPGPRPAAETVLARPSRPRRPTHQATPHAPRPHHDPPQPTPPRPHQRAPPAGPGILNLPRHNAPDAPNEALRMPINLALQRLHTHTQAEREQDTPTSRWFTALVNQLCLTPAKTKKDNKTTTVPEAGDTTWYTTITPLFAPAGRMTLTNNWTKAADYCRKDPTHLHAALTAWRRVDDYAGANLDYHSTGDAHMVSHGKPSQQGIPGATWLALHAFATFRLTGNTHHQQATSWQHSPDGPALTRPIWHRPLTKTAIITLLEHPLIHKTPHNPTKLATLGVTGIYTATRTRLTNSYGPLQPARLTHPLPHPRTTSEPQAHTQAKSPLRPYTSS